VQSPEEKTLPWFDQGMDLYTEPLAFLKNGDQAPQHMQYASFNEGAVL
jgi:hypothetical protein